MDTMIRKILISRRLSHRAHTRMVNIAISMIVDQWIVSWVRVNDTFSKSYSKDAQC
jgi:hypothetical protein